MGNTLKLFYGLPFLQFWRLRVKNNIFIQLTVNFYAVWRLIVDPGIETLLSSFWTTRARHTTHWGVFLFITKLRRSSSYAENSVIIICLSGQVSLRTVMRSCNWIVLISRLSKFIGSYSIFPVLKAAWKRKSYSSVLKSTVKIPLLVGSTLPPPGMWLYRLFSEASGVKGGGGGTGYLRSNILRFIIFLEMWRAGRKTAFLPAGYPEDISGLMEVSREFARN